MLIAGSAAPLRKAALVYLNPATLFAINNGTYTDIIWDTFLYDPYKIWDTQTRFIIPNGMLWARLAYSVEWGKGTFTGRREIELNKNAPQEWFGNPKNIIQAITDAGAETGNIQNGSTGWVPVNAGDYFYLHCSHGEPAPLNIKGAYFSTWFSIECVNKL